MEARIVFDNGRPKLAIDGAIVPPVLYGLSDIPGSHSNTHQAWKNIRNFSKAGIRIVQCDAALHCGWHKSTGFDTEPIKAEIENVVDADPGVGVIVRLHLNPPYWWLRDHPDELCVYRTPDGDVPGIDDGESDRLIRDDLSHHLRCSLASEVWRREAGERLARFCREADAEIPNLIGIQVACGVYGEWHQWGADVGKPMQAKFVDYLRKKYGTVENLRAVYGKDAAFETVAYRPEPFYPADDGDLRDPEKARQIMDSQMCLQCVAPENIVYFCDIIKKNFQKNILTGAFYGYYLNAIYPECVNIGHLMPEIIFDNKASVDFLCGPFPYLENREATEAPLQRGMLESCALNGILWLTEMDQHPEGTEMRKGGLLSKKAETVAQLRRNVFGPLAAGHGLWYYDHRITPWLITPESKNSSAASIYRKSGWWDTKYLMDEIAAIEKIAEKYCVRPYAHAADVLFVCDTQSLFSCTRYTGLAYAVYKAFIRTGAAMDFVYLSDFKKVDLSTYRLIIFTNLYVLDETQRQELKKATENKTVAWFYAAGYCDGKTLSTDGMMKTVGFDVKKTDEVKTSVTTSDGETLDFAGQEAPNPTFAVDGGEVLSRYDDGSAAAVKRGSVWFFAYPLISEAQAKRLVAESGAHVYADGDAVFAGSGLVIVNSPFGGEKRISFGNGKTVRTKFDGITTAVFDAETTERLL